MPARSERLTDQLTAPGTLLGGVSRVDLDDFPTGTLSLIGKDLYELRPTTIGDSLSQMMVLDHARYIEVLDCYSVVSLYKALGGLMRVVASLTGNLLVCLAEQSLRLLSTLLAFLATRHSPLSFRQTTLGVAVAARVLNPSLR